MTEHTSLFLILSEDGVLAAHVNDLLDRFGWTCRREHGLDRMAERPAAVLIDGRDARAAETIAEIRALDAPLNGTPILTLGVEPPGGPGGALAFPLGDEDLLQRLRHCAGPLGDHALRAEPWNPRYRLIRLLGLDGADAMLGRLREALAEESSAHRLAGIAGMCGFGDLSQAWSRVDRGEDGALGPARTASREAATEIDRLLGV